MKKFILIFIGCISLAVFMMNCSNQQQTNAAGRDTIAVTYSTASSQGDYATWRFDGITLTGTWLSLDSIGAINYTLNVVADCANYVNTYNYYNCVINTGTSTCVEGPGADNCPSLASYTIKTLETQSASIAVQIGTTGAQQLFTGFVSDTSTCSLNAAGDYTFIRLGLGHSKLFGVYRSDASFVSTTFGEFGLKASGVSNTISVQYMNDNSANGTVSFTSNGCTDGVRERTLASTRTRTMFTSNNQFVSDKGSLQGGSIGFKTSSAASPSQIQNKTFYGFKFNDTGTLEYIKVETGSSTTDIIYITTADFNGVLLTGLDIRALTNTTSLATNPTYPNFNLTPQNSPTNSYPYSNNTTLQPSFPIVSSVPRFYRIDGFTTADRVLLTATVVQNKTLLFGTGYAWRTVIDSPPTGGAYPVNGHYSNYNFVLFEK